MYSISISEKAKKELKKLPKPVVAKVFAKLESLSTNPTPPSTKQLINFDLPDNPFDGNLYRIRIGDYRVIYSIENKRLLILILRVAHRKEVYK